MKALAEHGIPSRPYFTPIHLQPFYAERFGYQRGDFPVTESLGDMSLALPFSGVMSEEQVDYVSEHMVRLGHVAHAGRQNNVGATLAVAPHHPGARGRAS